MDSNKFKYGIVFCGGGAKGAYQIGVWKRLRELGLDKEIVGVSGASIGAMNSMLFAQGDYETAEEVWMQARSDDMMALNLPLIKAVLKSLLPYTATSGAASILSVLFMATNPYLSAAALAGATSKLVGAGAVASAGLGIKEVLPHLGLFTRERLNDIIQGAVDPIGITTTDKRVYTALTALSGVHLPNRSVSTAVICSLYKRQ